ncbi:uncharacterized protein K02A2.6-like [Malaya genurostris]|uniref:uncharacterized protein K02A2.6-like n=1 Tax=Malaya genurostris TaxID=325434 RepID=UPI0026F39EB5|nr:uncharacterized protein K02A2.6-like [Malaya genurostris]
MAAAAENWVKSCEICATNGRPEKPTPMKRIFAPQAVWDTIALDFNGPYMKYNGISILVLVDYRSRYLMAHPVKTTKFEHTRNVLEEIFAREGFPRIIRSDNGPPFNGEEYAAYCAQRGIQTIYSTPLFPQQNGLVENYMKLINRAMSTAASGNKNFIYELRAVVNAHNAANHTVTGFPPEEVFLGRKIKRRLPLLTYKRADFSDDVLNKRDKEAKLRGKQQEDARRGARKYNVKPGDSVIIERTNRGKGDTRFAPHRYTVVRENNGNLVLSSNGQILRRHVSQVKKVFEWRHNFNHPAEEIKKRPMREKRTPEYLTDFVH